MPCSTVPRTLLFVIGGLVLLTAVKTSPLDGLISRAGGSAVDEVVVDRTFQVQPGQRFNARFGHADLTIETGAGREARVQITLEGRDAERARAFYDHLNFEVEQAGDVVSVFSRPGRTWNQDSGGARVRVHVTLPEVFDADLDVSHGDIHIDRMKGDVAVRLAHGDLVTSTLGGGALDLNVAHGNVEADGLMSDRTRIDLQHGDVHIGDVVGDTFEMTTAHGDVEIGRLDAVPRISSQHGDLRIRLAGSRGGELSAAHGNIVVSADADLAADLDLRGSDIDIASSFGFEGTLRDGTVEGRVNGGGPRLQARTTHGDIILRRDAQ